MNNIICEKCGIEYDKDKYGRCVSYSCNQADVKGIGFPPEGGRLLYVWGYKYPMLGFPTKDAMSAACGMKRSVLEFLRFISKSPIFLSFQVLFMRKKLLSNTLHFMGRVYQSDFMNHIQPLIAGNLLSRSTREIRRVLVEMFGEQLWIDGLIGAFEMDTAYRYRIQDIFGAIDLALLNENPRKEILTLFDIISKREEDVAVAGKMLMLKNIVSPAMFLSPTLRRNIVKFFTSIKMEDVLLTTNDLYWVGKIHTFNYRFNDMSYEQRAAYSFALEEGWQEEERPLLQPK